MPIEEAVIITLDINGGIEIEQSGEPKRTEAKTVTFCSFCLGDPLPAEFVCVTCSGLPLCVDCKNRHVSRMTTHETVPYEESSDVMCDVHPDKKLELCCVDPCNKAICLSCVVDHGGHKFTSLFAAAEAGVGRSHRGG